MFVCLNYRPSEENRKWKVNTKRCFCWSAASVRVHVRSVWHHTPERCRSIALNSKSESVSSIEVVGSSDGRRSHSSAKRLKHGSSAALQLWGTRRLYWMWSRRASHSIESIGLQRDPMRERWATLWVDYHFFAPCFPIGEPARPVAAGSSQVGWPLVFLLFLSQNFVLTSFSEFLTSEKRIKSDFWRFFRSLFLLISSAFSETFRKKSLRNQTDQVSSRRMLLTAFNWMLRPNSYECPRVATAQTVRLCHSTLVELARV